MCFYVRAFSNQKFSCFVSFLTLNFSFLKRGIKSKRGRARLEIVSAIIGVSLRTLTVSKEISSIRIQTLLKLKERSIESTVDQIFIVFIVFVSLKTRALR